LQKQKFSSNTDKVHQEKESNMAVIEKVLNKTPKSVSVSKAMKSIQQESLRQKSKKKRSL